MVCGEPQPERRTAEARIDTDGFFCNTAAVAAACNTTLAGREDSLLPLAKLLLLLQGLLAHRLARLA